MHDASKTILTTKSCLRIRFDIRQEIPVYVMQLLAQLIVEQSHVQRWLMKIDDEHLGRGHAYLDVAALPGISAALQLYAATVPAVSGIANS